MKVDALDASFCLAVAGAAYIWDPLALIVGATYLGVLAALAWREARAEALAAIPPAEEPAP